jgi:uncharacterized protein (TIGR00369 family)
MTGGTEEGMPREKIEAIIARTPFAVWIGAELTRYGDGQVELRVPLRRDLTQHHGFGHGAVVGFIADSACAWAAASVVGDVVTAEYKLNLLAPAVGEELIGSGSVIHAGGRQMVCRADVSVLRAGTSHLVATALATIAKLRA